MPLFGGIVDSYAYYLPTDRMAEPPPIPSSDRIPTEDTGWDGVDQVTYDGPMWSPSVCTSDGGIEAKDEDEAIGILERRHRFEWPETIDGWTLSSVRHDVLLDEDKA